MIENCIDLNLKTPDDSVSVTLSYTQLKTFSDGIVALLGALTVEDLQQDGMQPTSGDMTLAFNLDKQDLANMDNTLPTNIMQESEGMTSCRQQPLSVRMEESRLYKSA